MILLPITIINILGAILFTSVTGGIVTVLCVLAGKLLEKMGFVHIRFELLKLAAFFYLCPVAYIFVKLFEIEIGYGLLFNPTPFITMVSKCAWAVWWLGVILMLMYMLYDLHKLNKRYQDAFDCQVWMQDMLVEKMVQLGIHQGELHLCQSYRAKVPCVVGIWKPRIIMPVETYDEEALGIILTHELTHYKQRDVLLKRITFCIIVLHFFNPLAWVLFFQVQKQSEYVCDYRACGRIGDMKRYFSVLMRMASEDSGFSVLSSQLFERKHDLVERVRKMKQVSKMKKRSKLSVALVLAVAVLTSNLSVYAATMEGVEQYLAWYEETWDVTWAEPMELIPYVETVSFGVDEDVTVVVAEINQATRAVALLDWEINNNVKMCTGYFDCTKDGYINVSLNILPTDASVVVGIESMNGQAISIVGSGQIMHSFTIPSTSKWRFYIQNTSGGTITAEGSYLTP
ncbi:MAG: M56 family metallopeptidase [Lachnospiraceae bacterium]|nr:M56 family metallopeptidase [Lachnospiraceae bacterium]